MWVSLSILTQFILRNNIGFRRDQAIVTRLIVNANLALTAKPLNVTNPMKIIVIMLECSVARSNTFRPKNLHKKQL